MGCWVWMENMWKLTNKCLKERQQQILSNERDNIQKDPKEKPRLRKTKRSRNTKKTRISNGCGTSFIYESNIVIDQRLFVVVVCLFVFS